jgi:trk system potassium uptake protein
MNYLLVCKLQAVILAALTVAFGGSAALAATVDDATRHETALLGFLVSALIAGSCATGLFVISRQSSNLMFRREAFAVIGTGWITASFFGALPYYLILPEMGFAAALFESTSGLTTTGATVLSNLESLPPSLLFWRSISQWIGGLGVVVFFVAVLSFIGAGAKVLFSRESSAQAAELDAARVQRGVYQLMLLYLALTAACFGALMVAGMGWFEALNHAFTTISTGGFSTRSDSVAAFQSPAIEWVMITFMALGGTSFIVILRFLRGDWRSLGRSTEVKTYYLILAGATALIAVILGLEGTFGADWHRTLRASAFQVVSIMTTSGFATEDFDQWIPATHLILLVLMLIGGCSGSTSGGAKVIRVVIATRIMRQQIEKAYRAHVVRPLRANGENINRETQEAVLVFLVVLMLVAGAGLVLLALLEPRLGLEGTVSAVESTLFNIGPGFAEVGPTKTFAFFSDPSLVLLSLLMILGRVELFAVLVLFVPAFWRRY